MPIDEIDVYVREKVGKQKSYEITKLQTISPRDRNGGCHIAPIVRHPGISAAGRVASYDDDDL